LIALLPLFTGPNQSYRSGSAAVTDAEEFVNQVALHSVRLAYQPPTSNTFTQNKPAINHQPAVFFSQNKLAPVTGHRPNEYDVPVTTVEHVAVKENPDDRSTIQMLVLPLFQNICRY
jgi:hypothetical protein